MGVHNFVKVGNFWWRSIQWFCLLWAPQEFQNMFSCGSQIIVGTWIILVAWLKKIKKNTLHGFNPRYTDIDLWQDPRICIFNKQPGNSATSGLEASKHYATWLQLTEAFSPSPPITYQIPWYSFENQRDKGSPRFSKPIGYKLNALKKKYDCNNYKISYHLLSTHSV